VQKKRSVKNRVGLLNMCHRFVLDLETQIKNTNHAQTEIFIVYVSENSSYIFSFILFFSYFYSFFSPFFFE